MVKKYKIEDVRELFEKEGYTLLSDNYIDMHTKLYYVCQKGHKGHTNLVEWLFIKKRCKRCNRSIDYNYIKHSLEKEGYTLLSKEYIKASAKLEYMCPNGHKHAMPWNSFQQGHRCPECYGNVKLTIEEVRTSFLNEDWFY